MVKRISLAGNALVVLVFCFGYLPHKLHPATVRPNTAWEARVSLFRSLPNSPSDVYSVGDSITQRGEWSEWFGPNARNRGIDNDTTAGILRRLDEVTEGHPAKVYLMAGVNDLAQGHAPLEVARRISAIVATIQRQSPRTRIYLQDTMAIRPELRVGTLAKNQELLVGIERVNTELRKTKLPDMPTAGTLVHCPILVLPFLKNGRVNPHRLDNLQPQGIELFCRGRAFGLLFPA